MAAITLTRAKIDLVMPKLANGIHRYRDLQRSIRASGFRANEVFRKKYCYFYRITPHRNKGWQQHYFALLVRATKAKCNFRQILLEVKKRTGRIESSFASKLVASVHTNRPVIDKYVLLNAQLRLPYPSDRDRLQKTFVAYDLLDKAMHAFLASPDGLYLIREFTTMYGKHLVSEMKMLDFVLWQSRK